MSPDVLTYKVPASFGRQPDVVSLQENDAITPTTTHFSTIHSTPPARGSGTKNITSRLPNLVSRTAGCMDPDAMYLPGCTLDADAPLRDRPAGQSELQDIPRREPLR